LGASHHSANGHEYNDNNDDDADYDYDAGSDYH